MYGTMNLKFDNTSELTCPHRLACSKFLETLRRSISKAKDSTPHHNLRFLQHVNYYLEDGNTWPNSSNKCFCFRPHNTCQQMWGPLQKKGQRNPSDLQGTDGQMLRFCRGMRQLCAIHLTCCMEGKWKQQIFHSFQNSGHVKQDQCTAQ